jgi:hypothetical protein
MGTYEWQEAGNLDMIGVWTQPGLSIDKVEIGDRLEIVVNANEVSPGFRGNEVGRRFESRFPLRHFNWASIRQRLYRRAVLFACGKTTDELLQHGSLAQVSQPLRAGENRVLHAFDQASGFAISELVELIKGPLRQLPKVRSSQKLVHHRTNFVLNPE